MTGARAVALVVVLAAALWPELGRWRAERALREATAAFRTLAQAPRGSQPARAFEDVATHAAATADAIPGDQRGLIVAGSAQLLAGAPAEALARYRAALALGERAEIDLDLARAHAMLGDVPSAEAALLRMAWVSPPLLERLNAETRTRIGAEVARREASLRDGTLSAPPPLP